MLTFITLPGDFASSTWAIISGLYGDFSPIITLIIAVGLGLIILEVVVGVIRK